MAVDVELGNTIQPGVPRPLQSGLFSNRSTVDPTRHMMAVTPDGQNFLRRVSVAVTLIEGTEGIVSLAPPNFLPAGQGRGSIPAAGGWNRVDNGLTLVLHWTSWLRKETQ